MKNGRNILIFSTNYYPYVGGAEVAIKEITDRIDSFSFDLITARYSKTLPKQEKIGNVTVHRVGFGHSFDKFILPALGALKTLLLIIKNHPVLFWNMMATYGSGASYIANILRFWDHIPVVLTLQEGDSEEHIEKKRFGVVGVLWKILMLPVIAIHTLHRDNNKSATGSGSGLIATSWRLALSRTDAVTAISNYLAARALHYGFEGLVSVIPNGVNIPHFCKQYSEEELRELKDVLGKKNSHFYLVTTSRLTLKNALDDVIRALTHLPPEVYFLILGNGEDEQKLRALAQELGVSNRVKFLGLIDHVVMPKYLKISDAFIRPSLSEGMGVSFVEAMAAETPVIATPVGGIVDFLFDSEINPDVPPTGFFCNVRDPQSIAEQVERIMNYPALVSAGVKNAKELVIKKYDWTDVAKRMGEVFEKVSHKSM